MNTRSLQCSTWLVTVLFQSSLITDTATVTARSVLSPNPTTGRVTLNLVLLPSRPYMVAVVNATGQTVRTQELTGGQEHVLDLSALPTGLYVVRLAGAPGQHALRLIKQ